MCRGLMSTVSRGMALGEATVLGDCEGQSMNDKLSSLPSIRVSLSYFRLEVCVWGRFLRTIPSNG